MGTHTPTSDPPAARTVTRPAGGVHFDRELVARYDTRGPRYTSYPSAASFHRGVDAATYRRHVAASNGDLCPAPLSLYVHVPFCATVCYYCGCNRVVTANRERAVPYVERLRREIGLQGALFDGDRPVLQLHLGGGTPNFLTLAQLASVLEALHGHFRLAAPPALEAGIEIDPRGTDEVYLAGLRRLGFNRLSLGVQDLDPQVQAAVNRIQPEALTAATIDAARRLGFRSVSVDLIYGLPLQTVAGFARTLERVIAWRPDRVSVFGYAHLPERFRAQRQIDSDALPDGATRLALLAQAVERLTAAGYEYIGMDHFALPDDPLVTARREGTLTRNFQGYSTHGECDLVGLGVSAISQVGDCLAQNAATLEDYDRAIDEGRLAVVRGFELGPEDCLRRDVIQALMCQGEVDCGRIGDDYGIDFHHWFAEALERLAPMAADGLVELTPQRLRVTPRGRLLVRHIAMAFDQYLPADATRFSRAI